MRTSLRRIDPGLIRQIADEPQRFDFFQAVRILDRHLAQSPGARAGLGDLVSEKIRFENSLSLTFAPSQIEDVSMNYRLGDDGKPTNDLERVSLKPAFMGLLGLHGTLPTHYTERVGERVRYHRDTGSRAFMDLFSNRALGHFYRAWKKYRLPLEYESNRQDKFLPLVLSLAGLGFGSLRDRLRDTPGQVDDESMAYFAGMLRQRPVSAVTLGKTLSQYFRVPFAVEQFVGKWYSLPSDQHSRLGGKNVSLGKTVLVGERVWQRNLRVRLRIGPLSRAQYKAFLPGSELACALQKLLALITSFQFEYEVRPVLRAADVKASCLGAGTDGAQLGYDTFLLTCPAKTDRDDTVFELHAA